MAGDTAGELGSAQVHLTIHSTNQHGAPSRCQAVCQGPATATDMIEKKTHLGRNYIGGTGEGKDNKDGK